MRVILMIGGLLLLVMLALYGIAGSEAVQQPGSQTEGYTALSLAEQEMPGWVGFSVSNHMGHGLYL
jgi:Na+/proline symporter